jgi:uncharacterized membrane protein
VSKGRLEAFSDGVLAIIITIMVLELKVPEGTTLAALRPLVPVFLTYVLSFVYLAIYWNNHHHLLHTAQRVNASIMWANLHLLFWLSLVPFVTGWMGENHFAALPTALYGFDLLIAAIAYRWLQCALVTEHGRDSVLSAALGSDFKGKLSIALYLIAIGVAFVTQWIAHAIYVIVALMWFIPDQRIARKLGGRVGAPSPTEQPQK